MKTRNGFVSNSSSSSFAIPLRCLSGEQMDAIQNHIEYARANFPAISWADDENEWSITTTASSKLRGYTYMDNFDMEEFLGLIGVPSSVIEWDPEYEEEERDNEDGW